MYPQIEEYQLIKIKKKSLILLLLAEKGKRDNQII